MAPIHHHFELKAWPEQNYCSDFDYQHCAGTDCTNPEAAMKLNFNHKRVVVIGAGKVVWRWCAFLNGARQSLIRSPQGNNLYARFPIAAGPF